MLHFRNTLQLPKPRKTPMRIPGTVDLVLNQKPRTIWSIPPDAMVFDAIRLMSEKNIGALLVMQGDRLVGMLSERDYTRKVILRGKSSKTTAVHEIISSPVISVGPN